MSHFEAVFTSTTVPVCRICGKNMRLIKTRPYHVFHHVSSDRNCKIFTCKKCDFSETRISRIEKHAITHIKDKTKKYDLKEIHKYIENHKKENEKIISEMGMACFGSQMEIVRVLPSNGQLSNVVETENADDDLKKGIEDVAIVQDDIPMEETETVEPQRLQMIEPTPDRAMLLPTINDEQVFQQSNQIQPVVVLGRNVKNECHWIDLDDDDLDEVQQSHELEIVLVDQVDKNGGIVQTPLAPSANMGIFNNYRLQKEWDTEELIVNMRTVGRMLKFSKNVIDLTMNVIRENVMDGASMSYQAENLTEFFKLCPVVVGVRTAITKILQAMGQKELDD